MNAPVTRTAEGLPRRAFTVAEVERMTEAGIISPDERLEILGGEIVPMSPKGSRHEALKITLARHWGRMCPDDFVVATETGLRLDERTYLEPDFIVFSRSVRLAGVRGPDVLLAVEVADSSLDYDLKRKPAFYAGYGVHELWVIDAARRVVHVHTEPGKNGYGYVTVREAHERISPVAVPDAFAVALDALEDL